MADGPSSRQRLRQKACWRRRSSFFECLQDKSFFVNAAAKPAMKGIQAGYTRRCARRGRPKGRAAT
eukprot:8028595-Prorocentrum_lima.AAC.1